MTVKELISELEKMPQDARVIMWVNTEMGAGEVYSVGRRYSFEVHLNDKYYTPYAEEDGEDSGLHRPGGGWFND